jgi:hypothetical protein
LTGIELHRALSREANLNWKVKLVSPCFSSFPHWVPPHTGSTLIAILVVPDIKKIKELIY